MATLDSQPFLRSAKHWEKGSLYSILSTNGSENCVLECLELIETEFDIPAGLIRPNDKISQLVGEVQTRNPFRWVFYRAREEDIQSELNYQLGKRLRQYGTQRYWNKINTIGDFIRAWCGLLPSVEITEIT